MQDSKEDQMPDKGIKIDGDDNSVLQIGRVDSVVVQVVNFNVLPSTATPAPNMSASQVDRERMLAWGSISMTPIVAALGTRGWPAMSAAYLVMALACALYAYWPTLNNARVVRALRQWEQSR